MARNEEKQLARLNRWYLQKQRDEEAVKRPPRPKLESLHTVEDVKKWIPSITRDIGFYVKQMEVPCYPEHVISDFSQRIDRLRGEYKAYLRKLRDLCPEETQTPWTDRPYSAKRRKPSEQMGRDTSQQNDSKNSSEDAYSIRTTGSSILQNFVSLKTPILEQNEDSSTKVYFHAYNINTDTTCLPQCDLEDEQQNQPLDFQTAPIVNSGTEASSFTITTKKQNNKLNDDIDCDFNCDSEEKYLKLKSSKCGTSQDSGIVDDETNKIKDKFKEDSSIANSVTLLEANENEALVKTNERNKITMMKSAISLNLPYSDSSSDDSDDDNVT